jgi:hypothetical protein
MKRISLGIVVAALAVSAPRLTLAFLIGDGIHIPQQLEITILAITGIGSGIVLTVGNAVLAHALAAKAHQRGSLWWINVIAWMLFLVGAVILVAPTLVLGLRRSALAPVLNTPTAEWLWAVVAVVIVELLVGAAMAAAILVDEEQQPSRRRGTSRWSKLLDAATDRVAQSLTPVDDAPQPAPALANRADDEQMSPVLIESAADLASLARGAEIQPARTKAEAVKRTLEIFRQNPHASLEEVGRRIGRKASTVSRYLAELEATDRVRRNGNVVQVLEGGSS